MRMIIVTDAWHPQVNGVVRTIERTVQELEKRGHECLVIDPSGFRTIAAPTYPEIRLALFPYRRLAAMLDALPQAPTKLHIATEGPLGWAARKYCLRHNLPFSTAYHTKFPEYLAARAPIPTAWTYAMMRRFHARSSSVMVATPTLEKLLADNGFSNLNIWTRGVDTEMFRPREPLPLDLPRPIALYVGRVAIEKNIEAFLKADFPGSKLVVGNGPALEELQQRYPDVSFAGARQGEELAQYYASGDVFAFPSLTDTFGLVMLEALACGMPVAAYPVTGPLDILKGSDVAVLGEDLSTSLQQALTIDRQKCRDFALGYSWAAATDQFEANMPDAVMMGAA
ncbi:MAG: alpha-mannosyltransferase [Alphaproteobacteria bacterium]|nr:alpha-mannosyltransferase [Alphaproteobacteria bacterium]MAS46569.1 alpha-mannosyltransferase [Alphaproteobacteria bacterium]MAX94663.1 alpha-mannosyltransferase [Alphaproteobacteria bacterium]MBN53885.1 alpha-mannosyltransferase [Alphaproteobacteria bacterium]OUT41841.1 MAG: alpha-mannosyltransferase [Micavibrio sp. TMED2]